MNTILRNILAVIAGLLLGGIANMALVLTGPRLIPTPPGVNTADTASLAASIHLLEPKHFLFPFLAHAVGSLVGALVANLIGGSRRALLGYIVGGLTLIGGIAAARMIPAPAWFIALDLIVAYLPMAWLGNRLGQRLRPVQG